MIGNVVAARRTTFLGQSTIDTLATKAPSIAASAGTAAAIDTGAIAAGSALSIAIPVVGIALGALIGSLFAAHAARVAGAKQENTVLNSLIPTVQQAVSAVFAALNNGSAAASDGISALQQIESNYWQAVSQVEHAPGQAGNESQCVTVAGAGLHITGTPAVQNPPGSSYSGYGPAHMDKSCTASCAVGCMWVASWVNVGIALIQAGGGQVTFDGVVGNKYGLTNYPPLSISYTPPAPGSVAAASAALSAGNVSSVLAASIFGIPVWMIAAGLLAWKVL
ncbi:MAG TPA: hypothetical protein VJX23_03005 [Candidatus Binataceae bacterium]|nr:hypothetical protein [Candidatus Binataceae bacterium]